MNNLSIAAQNVAILNWHIYFTYLFVARIGDSPF